MDLPPNYKGTGWYCWNERPERQRTRLETRHITDTYVLGGINIHRKIDGDLRFLRR
jgi:hypothetical protein